jgi:multisubunit Na+/H+ antiporter MnhB subunit
MLWIAFSILILILGSLSSVIGIKLAGLIFYICTPIIFLIWFKYKKNKEKENPTKKGIVEICKERKWYIVGGIIIYVISIVGNIYIYNDDLHNFSGNIINYAKIA